MSGTEGGDYSNYWTCAERMRWRRKILLGSLRGTGHVRDRIIWTTILKPVNELFLLSSDVNPTLFSAYLSKHVASNPRIS